VQPASVFDSRRSERLLKETYEVTSLEVFGDFSPATMSACGALLDYVKLTQKTALPRLDAPKLQHVSQHMQIDAATMRNLEIMETLSGNKQGSLFSVIDQSVTAPGARLLASWLSAPLTDIARIHERQDNIQCLLEAVDLRAQVREFLSTCPD